MSVRYYLQREHLQQELFGVLGVVDAFSDYLSACTVVYERGSDALTDEQ